MNKDNMTVVLNIELTGDCSEETITAIVKKELDKQLLNHKPKFPKWEELGEIKGAWVTSEAEVLKCRVWKQPTVNNKNIWPTEELAEASLALSQLAQLRDYVNGDWKPDWTTSYTTKYIIYCNTLGVLDCYESENIVQHFLAFKDAETRDGFLEAYRDLIAVAKPLL